MGKKENSVLHVYAASSDGVLENSVAFPENWTALFAIKSGVYKAFSHKKAIRHKEEKSGQMRARTSKESNRMGLMFVVLII